MRSDFNPSGTGVAIVSLGTTGESTTLSYEEQMRVLHQTINFTNGRVPIVAGNFGGNDTFALVEKVKKSDFQGISAILSSSPAYNKPTQEGIYQHYMQLASSSPVPIVIYNVPSRTSSNISAKTCLRLAENSNQFLAIKDASGDMIQGRLIVKSKPEGFFVLSGDDETAVELIENGGEGVISVIANAYPTSFSEIIGNAMNGNFERAYEKNALFSNIQPLLYKEGNPAGIKAALEIRGMCTREVRLPLVAYTHESKSELKDQMSILNLSA